MPYSCTDCRGYFGVRTGTAVSSGSDEIPTRMVISNQSVLAKRRPKRPTELSYIFGGFVRFQQATPYSFQQCRTYGGHLCKKAHVERFLNESYLGLSGVTEENCGLASNKRVVTWFKNHRFVGAGAPSGEVNMDYRWRRAFRVCQDNPQMGGILLTIFVDECGSSTQTHLGESIFSACARV